MLALRRLRMDAHLWDLHEASLVAEGRSRPRKPEHFDRLLETRLTVIGRVTEGAALLEQPSRSDAELEAPVREHVHGRRRNVGRDDAHARADGEQLLELPRGDTATAHEHDGSSVEIEEQRHQLHRVLPTF